MFTFTVTITNDEIVEPSEEFYIDLVIPSEAASHVIKASPDSASVDITDNDSECCSNALYTSEHYQIYLNTDSHASDFKFVFKYCFSHCTMQPLVHY